MLHSALPCLALGVPLPSCGSVSCWKRMSSILSRACQQAALGVFRIHGVPLAGLSGPGAPPNN
jgi:hypothetical protein